MEKRDYWEKLFGPGLFQCLWKEKAFRDYFIETEEDHGKESEKIWTFSSDPLDEEKIEEIVDGDKILFFNFYKKFLVYALTRFEKRIENYKNVVSEAVKENLIEHLLGHLHSISIRTLISEIHDYKDQGLLKGRDSKEEYQYFEKEILGRPGFVQDICKRYPELFRCVLQKCDDMTDYYGEVVENFFKDRDRICSELFYGKRLERMTRISGNISDVHNQGKQVLVIQLDGAFELLYKPHSMENEQVYNRLMKWLSGKTGMDFYEYPFLSYETHSWSTIVPYKSCDTDEELKRYYLRMGVQIFLTYLLGTKDLHYENVIACGEYPVFIDLETLVNIQNIPEANTAGEAIRCWLSNSVLYSGLLPYYHWNKEEKGMDNSGIGGEGSQICPFRIPTIIYGGTSDIQVAYRYPTAGMGKNLARIKENFISPRWYKAQLIEGFERAYMQGMKHKKGLAEELKYVEQTKSRFLLLDTQKYGMLLSSSYHPSLLKDPKDRELFLWRLWKNRNKKDTAAIPSEMKSLLNGDIPYFSVKISGTSLITSHGDEIKDYFEKPARGILNERLEQLSLEDFEKQKELIEVSVELRKDERKAYVNRVYKACPEDLKTSIQSEKILSDMETLVRKWADHGVWNKDGTEINWYAVQMASFGEFSWSMLPLSNYLYDGLAGMLLLAKALEMSGYSGRVSDIGAVLKNQLFRYTDSVIKSGKYLQSGNTGAYSGESSIVYTYLALYEMTKETLYLDYAKKHAQIVEDLLDGDTRYDLLSGNAGAAEVFLRMYELLGDQQYLDSAEKAMEVLIKNQEKQISGIGWRIDPHMPPMAGMAHGNAGILWPVCHLWNLTGNEKYRRLAEEIWQYEESLYDPELNNWVDVRAKEETEDLTGPVAWCHGAAGILLSRHQCLRYIDDARWQKRLKKDMDRAYQKLSEYWKRDSWSLCHGIFGNLWIMETITGQKRYFDGDIQLLPQEQIQPGLMNGYGGLLYYLLRERKENLPNIFILGI